MKTSGLLTALLSSIALLSASVVCAAEAATPEAATTAHALDKTAAPKSLKRSVSAERKLTGSWRSVEAATNQAAPGTMYFQPGGALLMAPDGYKPLAGTWRASSTTIAAHTDEQGDVRIQYTLTDNHNVLHLHYDNGVEQTFFRMIFHPTSNVDSSPTTAQP